MKTEKEQKRSTAEIERSIEHQRSKKTLPEVEIELDNTKNQLLLDFKKMIDQRTATLDFEKNTDGEVESVTITRSLNGEVLFHANNKSWTGREDIKRVLGVINSGQPD